MNDSNNTSYCTDKGPAYAPPEKTHAVIAPCLGMGLTKHSNAPFSPNQGPPWVFCRTLAANPHPAPSHRKNLIFTDKQKMEPQLHGAKRCGNVVLKRAWFSHWGRG